MATKSEDMRQIIADYKLLTHEWAEKPQNLKVVGELLAKLKVALTKFNFLPAANSVASKDELLVACDILEIGAQYSILMKDIPSFERYIAQLKCYYMDYKDELPESAYKYQLLGLNLLCLLAQNRVGEFHTELELLPPKEIHGNIYISHPVSMEQYLMEGSYNKVFLARGSVPAESYNFFMDILLDTIRDEISACLEKAYDKIVFAEAIRMLFFQSDLKMKEHATKKNWSLSKDNYFHFNTEIKKTQESIPSQILALQAVEYARELEMIV